MLEAPTPPAAMWDFSFYAQPPFSSSEWLYNVSVSFEKKTDFDGVEGDELHSTLR